MLPEVAIPRISVLIELKAQDGLDVDAGLIDPMITKLGQGYDVQDVVATLDDQKVKFDLTFAYGTDMDFAYLEVTELVEMVLRSLPYPYQRPVIFRHNLSDLPVLFIQITSDKVHSSELEFSRLSDFTYNRLKRQLEQLEEVAFIDIAGGQFEEITIDPKLAKLAALKANESVIFEALARQNLNMKTYSIKNGNYYRALQVTAQVRSLDELRKTAVLIGSRVFELHELAHISVRLQSNKGFIYADGHRAVSLAVIKSGSSRMGKLKQRVEEVLKHTQAQNPELTFQVTRDQSQLLDDSIGGLKTSLLLGLLFAGLAILLLNRNLYHALIILISVPVALTVTFLFFELFGLTINIITLSGLTICVGLMIDNTIIVLDNISQKQEREPLLVAAETGTLEVIRPLLTSMLTTCSLFVPLIFLSGLAGALFYDQAVTIAIGLVVSFLIAIIVLPTVYAALDLGRLTHSKVRTALLDRYHRLLTWAYNKAGLTLLGFLLFLAVLLLYFRQLEYNTFPEIKEDYTVLDIKWEDMHTGPGIEQQINALHERFRDEFVTFNAYVGPNSFLLDASKDQRAHESRIIFRPKATAQELRQQLESYLAYHHPYATYEMTQSKTPVSYVFDTDEDTDATLYNRKGVDETTFTKQVVAKVESIDPAISVQSAGTVEKLFLNYDAQKLMQYRVDYTVFVNRLRLLVDRLQPEVNFDNQRGEPVTFISGPENLESRLATSQIMNKDSVFIPMRNLVALERRQVPARQYFDRKGEFERLGIEGLPDEGTRRLQEILAPELRNGSLELDRNFSQRLGFLDELTVIFFTSIALLYFILAIQFESLTQPLIVLSEIPVGLSGGLWLLMLLGGTLNIMAGIGLVFLAGIMINDSILKIDQINRLRVEYPLEVAIKQAGKYRFNAIVATSFTTIASLIPLIMFEHLGSALQRPLALVLVGGMVTSTLASLYLIPIIYKWVYARETKAK